MRTGAKLAVEGGTPVRSDFLPFALPQFGREEKDEILAALDSGWITTGPRVRRFEEALAEYLGTPHVICVDSCTAALHLALVTLDLQPGDQVVTSPLTFCSTVNVILHAGGEPVLADVEPGTWNLDPACVEAALTPRTRAILPVHYGGHPCAMDALLDLAGRRGVPVIEDAAHALGASYRGKRAGTLGDVGCFSFYATKNVTTAEGGALATRDPVRAERMRLLSLHGMSRDAWRRYTSTGSWYYEVLAPGFKYNMTDLEAALGIHQLRRLPGFQARRRALARRYTEALAAWPELELPGERPEVEHAYHLYAVRFRPECFSVDRGRLIEALQAENIGTSVHFIPIHYHPFYRERLGLARGAFPVAEGAYEGLISLPIYPRMTDGDADDVIAAVGKVIAAYAH